MFWAQNLKKCFTCEIVCQVKGFGFGIINWRKISFSINSWWKSANESGSETIPNWGKQMDLNVQLTFFKSRWTSWRLLYRSDDFLLLFQKSIQIYFLVPKVNLNLQIFHRYKTFTYWPTFFKLGYFYQNKFYHKLFKKLKEHFLLWNLLWIF